MRAEGTSLPGWGGGGEIIVSAEGTSLVGG